MNLMAACSDTDIKQAALMSRLSGRPAAVTGDIFVWNGRIVDRASAVVALLKVYSQVPVSTAAKERLCNQYHQKFSNEDSDFVISVDDASSTRSEIWFYKLCKAIKGEVAVRSETEIKEILIILHS